MYVPFAVSLFRSVKKYVTHLINCELMPSRWSSATQAVGVGAMACLLYSVHASQHSDYIHAEALKEPAEDPPVEKLATHRTEGHGVRFVID